MKTSLNVTTWNCLNSWFAGFPWFNFWTSELFKETLGCGCSCIFFRCSLWAHIWVWVWKHWRQLNPDAHRVRETDVRGHVLFQLHIAASCGYTRVVQFLISHKVKLGVVDNDSWQPIHCAGYWAQVGTVCHTFIALSFTQLCVYSCILLSYFLLHTMTSIFRSSPWRWPSRLELRCVRTSVRTSTKSFSDFHLISCVGRPWSHMHTSVTSTRSKVKIKVTELPKLRKVHFSTSISSAISAWSSKVMVGGHSMGPGLQLVGAGFLNFHPGKLSQEFKLRPVSIFDEIQMAIFRQCVILQSRGWACR